MKPKSGSIWQLVAVCVSLASAPLFSMVTAVGVDSTTGPNWRTAAALEADGEYGSLGYVVFGLNVADSVYTQPFNAGQDNPGNAYNLPSGVTVTTADTNIGMWSGNGNFGTIEDPGAENGITATPVLANSAGPKRFTITRANNVGYRITLLTASGDGAGATYSPSVNDGSGAAATSHAHTQNGLAYHVFQVSPGTSDIVINITSTPNWSLTGIAFDEFVVVPEGPPLAWIGASNLWDTTTAGNWKTVSNGNAALYSNSPANPVVFDDTATSTTLEIPEDVSPISVEFNNSTNNYTLQGAGGVAGFAGISKLGSGTLTILNTNTYSGATSIFDGSLIWSGVGQLGGGNYGAAIINDGALIYGSSADQTLSGAISGTGGVTQNGPGTLRLSGVSSYEGNVLVNEGVLVAARATANSLTGAFGNLQIPDKTITVNSGGTLRHGSNDLYFNSVVGRTNAQAKIIIDGGVLDTNTFFSDIKDIELHSGASIIGTNGVVNGFRSLGLTGTVTTHGGSGVASTIDSPGASGGIHLGNSGLGVASATFDVDAASGGLIISGPIFNQAGALGASSLIKNGDGTLTLSGVNTYTGTTLVNGGTLVVTGSLETAPNPVVVNDTATLTGDGTINRPVTIASGGTLTPAGSELGWMVIDRLSLGNGSKTIVQVDKSGAVLTQDLIETTSVHYGGTLEIIASGDTLAVGDSFKLFDATESYSGAFSELIKPALPAGLWWDFSGLTADGTIAVVETAPTPFFSPSSGNYVGAQSVTIDSEPGATIHYTTDGSDPRTSPTATSATSPASGVVVPTDAATFTLTAYATLPGAGDSALATATYATITTPMWNVDEDGNWSEADKWKHNVIPDAADVTADFNAFPQSGNANVTLDSSRTVGTLVFGSADAHDWALSSTPGNVLTLATGSGTPLINVVNETATVGPILAGTQGFSKSGTGTLRLTNGGNRFSGDLTVAEGLLVATASVGGLNPASGSLGNPRVARTVTINSGATLSMGANDIFGNHSSAANVAMVIDAGGTLVNNGNFFNILGPLTLKGGTLHAIGGADPSFPAFSFKGGITATAGVSSTISGIGTNATYHLGDNEVIETTIDVQGDGVLDIPAVLQNGQSGGLATSLVKTGTGTLTLGGINTYNGNTTVNAGTLVLTEGAQLRFVIGATSGLNNQISGAGTVTVNGAFAINTAAANALTSGSWKLEDVASLTGGYGATFAAVDPDGTPWTDGGDNTWTKDNGAGIIWTFNEVTGTLVLGEGSTGNFASWAAENGVTGGPGGDSDFDGIPNLVEYALDLNPAGSDGSAGSFDGSKVTFTKRALAVAQGDVTYAIEASADLGLTQPWLPVTPLINDDSTIEYVLPEGQGTYFVRLVVSLVP